MNKSAEEIAEQIFLWILPAYRQPGRVIPKEEIDLIAKALDEYASEARAEGFEAGREDPRMYEKGAASMRARAAKEVDFRFAAKLGCDVNLITRVIRALPLIEGNKT